MQAQGHALEKDCPAPNQCEAVRFLGTIDVNSRRTEREGMRSSGDADPRQLGIVRNVLTLSARLV